VTGPPLIKSRPSFDGAPLSGVIVISVHLIRCLPRHSDHNSHTIPRTRLSRLLSVLYERHFSSKELITGNRKVVCSGFLCSVEKADVERNEQVRVQATSNYIVVLLGPGPSEPTRSARPGMEKTFPTAKGTPTLDDVAALIKNEKAKNIIVLVGAGISTAAGIPGKTVRPIVPGALLILLSQTCWSKCES
jgi:hypothetical protein